MDKKISIRPVVVQMKVNEQVVYPLRVVDSVRAVLAAVGAKFDRKYTTKTDRMTGTITVTRMS